MKLTELNKRLIYTVGFFLSSGYYAGLAIIISEKGIAFSKYYSIPLRAVLVIIMFILILKSSQYWNKKTDRQYLMIMLLFSIFYIIKVFYSELIVTSGIQLSRKWYEYIFYFLSFSILPFFTFSLLDFTSYKKIILNSLIFSGFILSILSIYFYKSILSAGVGRISMVKYENSESQTLSPLALSYCGTITILLCMYKIIFEKINNVLYKIYMYVVIALSFIIFFLGASRGSLIGLVLTTLFFIYSSSAKYKARIFVFTLIAVPLIILGAQKTGSSIFTRMNNTIETGQNGGRVILYKDAFNEFLKFPFLGGRIEVSGVYPHNIFLEALMATGFFGFLLLSFLIITAFRRGLQLCKKDKIFLIPMSVFLLGFSQSMFSGSIYDATFIFAGMGIIYSGTIQRTKIIN